jgi:hypothetical protein
MSEQTLKTSLDQLRKQLAHPEELDEETRRQLADVADTIERVLEEPEPDYGEAHASVQSIALGFEARHPRFSRILSDVTDALAKLGI